MAAAKGKSILPEETTTELVRVFPADVARIDSQALAKREPRADIIKRLLDRLDIPYAEPSA